MTSSRGSSGRNCRRTSGSLWSSKTSRAPADASRWSTSKTSRRTGTRLWWPPADNKIKSVKDLVVYGKANPDKSNYATSSPAFTITTELFKLKTGMPAVQVPYESSNEMMLSVAGGTTLFAIADGPPTMPLVQGGKIRALAVTGSERSSELPDVPSMGETGYPEVNIGLWSGIFVVAGTPPAIANKLGKEARRALADPGVREKLKAMAVNPGGGPGEEFRKKIDADIKVFADVVKAANLKFEE